MREGRLVVVVSTSVVVSEIVMWLVAVVNFVAKHLKFAQLR